MNSVVLTLALLGLASATPLLLSPANSAPLVGDLALATADWEDCGSEGAEIQDIQVGTGFVRASFVTSIQVTAPAPITMKATNRDGSNVDFPAQDLCQLGLPCPIAPSPLVLNLRTQSSWASLQFETDTNDKKLICFKVNFSAMQQMLPAVEVAELAVAPVDIAWTLRAQQFRPVSEWKDCGSSRAVVDNVIFRQGQVTVVFQNTEPVQAPSPIEITVDGRTQNADFCRLGLDCPIPPQQLQLTLNLGTASSAKFEAWHLRRGGDVILCVEFQL